MTFFTQHETYNYTFIYRKSSNNSPGAYLPKNIFWVGAYLNGGGLIHLEEL